MQSYTMQCHTMQCRTMQLAHKSHYHLHHTSLHLCTCAVSYFCLSVKHLCHFWVRKDLFEYHPSVRPSVSNTNLNQYNQTKTKTFKHPKYAIFFKTRWLTWTWWTCTWWTWAWWTWRWWTRTWWTRVRGWHGHGGGHGCGGRGRGGHGHDGHGHVLTQCNAALIVIIIQDLIIFKSWPADLII